METIIQQIAQELIDSVTKKVLSEKIFDVDALAEEVEEDCRRAGREIIEAAVSELNRSIRRDKRGRKELELVLKEKERPRTLYTKLGNLRLDRDYYYDCSRCEYTYPVDHIIGVRPYERVGSTVGAELVNAAAEVSYAKSAAAVTRGEISRQTVRNRILKVNVPEQEAPEEKHEVSELHIYADEDHVSMQKPEKARGKLNQIVPLVTVTEGTENVCCRRNRTLSAVHFVDGDFDSKRLWKSVEGYIAKAYGMDELEKVYVHGDGGPWIKNGLEDLAQTVHVMDGYHFEKALKKVSKAFPERNVRLAIRAAVAGNEPEKADSFLQSLLESADEKQIKKVQEFETYLMNSWAAVRALKTLDIPGSCTEGQISHVLSERFSRDPAGWSRKVLGKLCQIRVYRANGNVIAAEDLKEHTETERYHEYADRFVKESVAGRHDWSIFEGEPQVFDMASGTQMLVSQYGKNHGVPMS